MRETNDSKNGFAFDRRGVSEVIGSILVFGLVIALISIIQVQAIPNANGDIEFRHSQSVQEDLTSLQSSMSRTGFQADRGSTPVKLGTGYPTRLLFYSPPPASGTLRTEDRGTIQLQNVESNENEVDDYFSAESNVFEFNTSSIIYSANYNQYDQAPKSIIEGTIAYQNYSGETRIRSTGRLVDERQITLLLVNGSLSESGVDATSIETTPLSAPAQAVSVTNSSDKTMTLTIPTRISEETWVTELLADEIDEPGMGSEATACSDLSHDDFDSNDDRYVVDCSWNTNAITLEFEQDSTYDLRVAKIGMGKTEQKPDARYIVPKGDSTISALENGEAQITVEVRDRYNNPVSGTEVTFELPDDSTEIVKSNAAGEATVTYEPSSPGSKTVRAKIGDSAEEKVQFSLQVISPGRKTVINPASGVVLKTTGQANCGGLLGLFESCHATATVENEGNVTKTFEEVRLSVYADTSGSEPPAHADIGAQNANASIEDIQVGGKAEEFDKTVSIDPNNEETLLFQFEDGDYSADGGDFFILEAEFEDGSSATYFIPVTP